jgi:hypothetical protein
VNRAPDGRVAPNDTPRHVVMVVEDDIWIRLMISDELRGAGFEVIECGSADEAIARWNTGFDCFQRYQASRLNQRPWFGKNGEARISRPADPVGIQRSAAGRQHAA